MKPARLSLQAAIDLDEIWDWIAKDSYEAADRFVAELKRRCDELFLLPAAGRDRSDLELGLRTVPYRAYLILYRVRVDWIEVSRIIHGPRDLPALFGDE